MEEALWNAYGENRSVDNRNALMAFYWPFVQKAVRMLAFRARIPVTYHDALLSDCVLRLLRAVELYEPERHVKFTVFCTNGIRYEVLEHQRRTLTKQKRIESSIESGLDLSESRGERVCVDDPEDAIRKKEFWNAVAEPLSESERRLLRLLYECWQTYRQAGKTLGVSGSTVGHMHAQILQRLRTKFSYEQLREIVAD